MGYLDNLGKQIFKTFMIASVLDMVLAIILQSVGLAVVALILVNFAMLGECVSSAAIKTTDMQKREMAKVLNVLFEKDEEEEKKNADAKDTDKHNVVRDGNLLSV